MSSTELQLLEAIALFILIIFLVKRINKGKKRYDPRNSLQGAGQFFDNGTYRGNIRSIVLACLWIYAGRHIDEMMQWLWHQFGSDLIVTPAKAEWHARVALALGMIVLVISILNIQRVYKDNKRSSRLRTKTDDEVVLRLKEYEEEKSLLDTTRD